MAIFSIIIEDAILKAPGIVIYDNRRVESIDADDLNDAWMQARRKYNIQRAEPNTQIVDIKPGTVVLQEEPQTEPTLPLQSEENG
jgi:hypothetical protein